MTTHEFTPEQYCTLGMLVQRWATHGNRYTFEVSKEIAGPALLCVVTDNTGAGPLSITHGIEPDGYCHT